MAQNDLTQGIRTDIVEQIAEVQAARQEQNTALLSEQPWNRPVPGGPLGMLGPGSPVLPVWAEDRPRVFQYRIGYNLNYIPRQGYGLASFATLRNLASVCYEARLNIELIKREIRALEWEITTEDGVTDETGQPELEAFFDHPDGYLEFDQWMNALVEEMLVIDAPCIYPNMNQGGGVLSLDVVQGDTIKPLLDFRGRIPDDPVPAFMQILYGIPRWSGPRSSLIYRPFNNVAYSPYGYPPLEFMLLIVNLAVRRASKQVMTFTAGNMPEALVGAPAMWTQEQIQHWQEYWDALVAGKITQQTQMKWIPTQGTGAGLPVYEFVKDEMGNTARDTWLMQVACWAFGNSPSEFGLIPGSGLGGKGFMQNMENIQYRSMVGPLSQFLEKLMTGIIHERFKRPNLVFRWKWNDPKPDILVQAQVDGIYIDKGVYGPDYVQDRLSIPPEFVETAPEPTPPGLGGLAGTWGGETTATPTAPVGGAPLGKFFRQPAWHTYG